MEEDIGYQCFDRWLVGEEEHPMHSVGGIEYTYPYPYATILLLQKL